jgi:uncharacterized protein (DUF4415 family)
VIRIISAREATAREKRSITIRLDDDLLLYFKKKAGERKVGYQTLVNEALREYVNRHGTTGRSEER